VSKLLSETLQCAAKFLLALCLVQDLTGQTNETLAGRLRTGLLLPRPRA